MSASLVGSEMCIRDRAIPEARAPAPPRKFCSHRPRIPRRTPFAWRKGPCLLYTSDAADDM
eukprot:12248082-Alexandrium_andersonii.AAC.1